MGLSIAIGDNRFYPGNDTILPKKDAILCQTCYCPVFYPIRVEGHPSINVTFTSFARRFAQDADNISPG